ncbi:MAG TPA: response regulator [Candidatus Limnocylindria bacterium]|nr:response regulator [Candidatus Limnocylindria bacterium]
MATQTKPSVLLVEDEKDIRELVRYHLAGEGYEVREADSGEAAAAALRAGVPDLVVLDIMLPGIDGLALCRRLRATEATAGVPIVMLTAKAAEVDRVLGLEMGADDYITKPFSPRELVARVKAVMRRARPTDVAVGLDVYERGRLRIDFDRYEVVLDDRPLALSLREFELLKFFVKNPHKVYDRLQLLDCVWGQEVHVEPRTVDVHVRRLRRQIERNDAVPELILTVRGVGYKFNPDALDR